MEKPMNLLYWDHGEFPSDAKTFHRYMLLVICCVTKFIWAGSFLSRKSSEVRNFLKHQIFQRELCPQHLRCDNAKEFRSELIEDMVNEIGADLKHIPPRHPSQQGQIERYVGVIKSGVAALIGVRFNCKSKGISWVEFMHAKTENHNKSAKPGSSISLSKPFVALKTLILAFSPTTRA